MNNFLLMLEKGKRRLFERPSLFREVDDSTRRGLQPARMTEARQTDVGLVIQSGGGEFALFIFR